MDNKNNTLKFTPRELDVLNILWSSDEPLIASDIAKRGDGLSINTVQVVLRELLKREIIEIADIVYSGTVLTRRYEPVLSENGLKMEKLKNQFDSIDKEKVSVPSILASLIESEEDEENIIKELEQLVQDREKEISDKEG